MIMQYPSSARNAFEAKSVFSFFFFVQRERAKIEGLALCHWNWMQLFALFNIFVICLAGKKLVSLACELGSWCVCIIPQHGPKHQRWSEGGGRAFGKEIEHSNRKEM